MPVQSRSRTGTTLGLMPAMDDISARRWFPMACIELLRWVYSVHTPTSSLTPARLLHLTFVFHY
jgi:hypothetical protein